MTPEVLSIIGIGFVLTGVILSGQRAEHAEERIADLEQRIAVLDHGQTNLEDPIGGSCEAVSGRRMAAGDN